MNGDRPDLLPALARVLAGTLRPPSVLDRLLPEVKASFGPVALRAALLDEQGHVESAKGDADPALDAILRRALQSGTPVTGGPDTPELLAIPFAGRQQLLGGIALRLPRPATPQDAGALETVAALVAVALEGARLATAAERRAASWEGAVDAVGLALCVLDPAGRVEFVTPAFSTLLGAPAPALAGRPWPDLLPPAWHAPLRDALFGTPPQGIEVHHGGRVLAASVFRTVEGGRTVLRLEDETDRRGLQDRLVQAEKLSAIGQLIAGVAHDLNNPLTSVVGFADFLAEAAETPPRIREPLRVIQQEAERASKIVKNLLSFARRQETRQPTGLGPMLEATLGLFRNHLVADRVALESELADDLPDLDLNPNQIQQVFVNLIQNAQQAIVSTGRPGTIRLTARRWMDGVAVEVEDDGCGMDPGTAARVFEPFFTTKPEGQGTGLGLSISQGIVKEHGGRITYRPRAGGGATFVVELPGPTDDRPAPAATPAHMPVRALRVLVVDDEQHILHYMRATLEAWGHTVTTAADGEAALALAIGEPYDLILSDLRMPRLGGREFFEALRREAPAAAGRVAFSTGDTVRDDTLRFLAEHGRPCLHKPFSLSELRSLLRDAARG